MKVVILAGGFGTRISEYTDVIPKPMVPVGGVPIIERIMMHFSNYGFNEFIIALGYKGDVIKNHFLNYKNYLSDISIDFRSQNIEYRKKMELNWSVDLVDTGFNTMTGGRLSRLREYLQSQSFFMTYGDGICDVDLNSLVNFHKISSAENTVTAVRPLARFGELKIGADNVVKNFCEKPQTNQGWINGGFFILNSSIFEAIQSDDTVLEQSVFPKLALDGKLNAYKHHGFWRCMDTKRDKDDLDLYFRDLEKFRG